MSALGPTPVVVVTGIDPEAMAATVVGLQWDLPEAVVVHHHIDVTRQVLTRVVSDATGVLEREQTPLAHACVACAFREDVLPTLERLAALDRWATIVAHLPVAAEAEQLCAVLARDARLARLLRVSCVVTATPGERLEDDLIGDEVLLERGLQTSRDDERGVGEVLCGLVEFADVVALTGAAEPRALDLVQRLARPGIPVVEGVEHLDATVLASATHDHARTAAWTDPFHLDRLSGTDASLSAGTGAWQLDLHSERPFHPSRLLAGLERIGAGRHRSRGVLWLPTRPDRSVLWDGAGGQVSLGLGEPWGRRTPATRLVLTGTGPAPEGLRTAFEELLVRPAEHPHLRWRAAEDGFEPWLGPTRAGA